MIAKGNATICVFSSRFSIFQSDTQSFEAVPNRPWLPFHVMFHNDVAGRTGNLFDYFLSHPVMCICRWHIVFSNFCSIIKLKFATLLSYFCGNHVKSKSNFRISAYYEKTLVHIMMNQRFCILFLFIFLLLTYGNATPRLPYHWQMS